MKIKEIWNIFGLVTPLIIAVFLMNWATRSGNHLLGLCAIIFGWQAGWGVKLGYEMERIEKEIEAKEEGDQDEEEV